MSAKFPRGGSKPILSHPSISSINCPTAIGRTKFWPVTSCVLILAQYHARIQKVCQRESTFDNVFFQLLRGEMTQIPL